MPFEGSARTINEQQGSTLTTLVPKPAASPKHNSGTSEPHPIQQVSGPVSPAEVGLREQMESVNNDFKLKAGNNKNLNKDAAQKIGTTRIGNITTTSQFGGFPSVLQGRRVDLDIGNNENQGTTQEIGGLELFNVDGPPTHQDRGRKCSIL